MFFHTEGRRCDIIPLNNSSKQYSLSLVKSIIILLLLVTSKVCCKVDILLINGEAHTNCLYSNTSLSISISLLWINRSSDSTLLNPVSASDCEISVGVIVFVSSSGISSISSPNNYFLTTFNVSTNFNS